MAKLIRLHQPFINNVLKSEPGFSCPVDAELVGTANDYIHHDPNGEHLRLDTHAVVK